MEDHHNCILDWTPYLYKHSKSIEELRESVWLTTLMELEANRVRVEEETNRDYRLKHLLNDTVNQTNKYQSLLLLDKYQFHHQTTTAPPPHFGEHEPIITDCQETIVSSPPKKELPENGKFLEAVMKAGPLLQNLLLAGSLPQWRHPPPPLTLDMYQIPSPPPLLNQDYLRNITTTTTNCCHLNKNKKRLFSEDSDSSIEMKYQRIYLN